MGKSAARGNRRKDSTPRRVCQGGMHPSRAPGSKLFLLPWPDHQLWLPCNFRILLLSFFTFHTVEWFSSRCTSVVSTPCPSSHPTPHTVPSLLPSLAMSHPCECISRSAIKSFIFHSGAENISLCRRPQTHPMSPMSGQAITPPVGTEEVSLPPLGSGVPLATGS